MYDCEHPDPTGKFVTASFLQRGTRRWLGTAGIGILTLAAFLTLVLEQLSVWAIAAAAVSLICLARWGLVSGRVLVVTVCGVLLVFAYVWTLDEPLHIVIHADPSRYVVAVGSRTTSFPAAGKGRVGLYVGRSSDFPVSALGDAPPPSGGLLATLAKAFRFAGPGPAWAHVRLTTSKRVEDERALFRLPAHGWHRNVRGELAGTREGSALLSTREYTRFTLSADLMRAAGVQGVLIGVGHTGSGFLLELRMDAASSSWKRWAGGTSTLIAGAPFVVSPAGMVRRALRAVLPSALFALLLLAPAAIIRGASRPRASESHTNRCTPESLTDAGAVLLALGGGVATAMIASSLFGRVPNVQDAVAYLFQAKTLALGRLWVPAPAHLSFFQVEFLPVYHGHWFGKYPPGWPLLLALGVLLGQPWLVNPALVAASLFLLYLIGRTAYHRSVGLLAALFAATSPFILFIGGSFLAQPATLFYASGFVALVVRWDTIARRDEPRATGASREHLLLAAAGALLGMAFVTRELDALALAWPFALVFVRRVRAGLWVLAGAVTPVVAWLAYNRELTGSFTTTPYTLWWSFDRLGFGRSIGGPEPGRRGFTVAQGIWNMGSDLQSLQAHLFGWPFYFALALATIPFLLGRVNRWDVLFAASACSVVIAYVFYFNPGLWYGPRYYYVIAPWVALLSARGVVELYRFGSPAAAFIPWSKPATVYTVLLVAGLVAFDVGYYIPAQIPTYRVWNRESAGTAADLRSLHIPRSVIFVAGPESVYDAAFSFNSPLLTCPVYARDEGSRNALVASRCSQRAYYAYPRHHRSAHAPPLAR